MDLHDISLLATGAILGLVVGLMIGKARYARPRKIRVTMPE